MAFGCRQPAGQNLRRFRFVEEEALEMTVHDHTSSLTVTIATSEPAVDLMAISRGGVAKSRFNIARKSRISNKTSCGRLVLSVGCRGPRVASFGLMENGN